MPAPLQSPKYSDLLQRRIDSALERAREHMRLAKRELRRALKLSEQTEGSAR